MHVLKGINLFLGLTQQLGSPERNLSTKEKFGKMVNMIAKIDEILNSGITILGKLKFLVWVESGTLSFGT